MIRSSLSVLSLALLFFVAAPVRAEGGCPPGQYPQNGQGFQTCVPIPGQQQQTQQVPVARWADRWQATAADIPKGILGTSKGLANAGDAEKQAINDCREKGGTACELQVSAKNGCIVMVVGEKTLNFKSAATESEAKLAAYEQCSRTNSQCTVHYAECSPPVRIQ
ncbi:protein of unknown function [Dyella sp. 333MFSha]|nr:protein of unknown function [Dyella sp. 333MFSha]